MSSNNNLGDAIKVVSSVATPALSLPDGKIHLRVTTDDDDADITSKIAEAQRRVERVLGMTLITKTLRLSLDAFPGTNCPIKLALGPVQSIESLKYIDTNGDEQTWDAAEYQVNVDLMPGLVKPVSGGVWPSTQVDTFAAVKVEYKAGFGDAAADIDIEADFEAALKLTLGHIYENREEVTVGPKGHEVPQAAMDIMNTARNRNL